MQLKFWQSSPGAPAIFRRKKIECLDGDGIWLVCSVKDKQQGERKEEEYPCADVFDIAIKRVC